MIRKVFKIKNIKNGSSITDDLNFWLTKSPGDRISAIEYLRRQYDGNTARLQRVVRVIQRS